MSGDSTAKKMGEVVGLLFRQIQRSRIGGAVLAGVKATATSFARVIHILWLEVTGFIFLCLGMFGASAALREYHKSGVAGAGSNRFFAAVIFTLLFAYFGLSSFWRARRKGHRAS